MGGEGEGLRFNLRKKGGFVFGVVGVRAGMGGVYSFNVSVAAGMLCEAFLRGARGEGRFVEGWEKTVGEGVEMGYGVGGMDAEGSEVAGGRLF